MRSVYRVLAYLVALAVVFQASMIAFAVFGLRRWVISGGGVLDGATVQAHAGGFSESIGFLLHQKNGQIVVPVIAVLLLISSFFAKVSGGVAWAGVVLVTVIVQVLLGTFATSVPALGILHGIGALTLFAVAVIAARCAGASLAGSRASTSRDTAKVA